jgi:hypothetical protein
MKKFIAITILMIVAISGFSAVSRTIKADKVLSADPTSPNSITWSYTGVAADTLTKIQTSLIYNITVNKAVPMNYYIKVGLDSIGGAEVLATITINGRMFDDEAWTLIETVNTAAVEAEVNTVIESMTDPDFTLVTAAAVDTISQIIITDADTVLVAARTTTPTVSIKPCWRQIQVVISVNGGNIKAKGIALKDIRWYFQEAK